ncbi:MAG: dephospho-CoA kinase [Opitutales bacterium]|nr:dephospho-CoA kinase [Opitutales bacterium]
MKKDVLIALTGSIGAGKSMAAKAFAACGARVFDADALSKKVLFEDAEAKAQVRNLLGDCCFDGDAPNAKKIAEIVFADAEKLAALEKIIHPKVGKLWRRACAGGGVCVVEIPLLFEKNLEKEFDFCVSVFCSEKVRRERLLQRGLSDSEIDGRSKFQMPQAEKVARSHSAFFNDGSADFLKAQVQVFLSRL